MKIRKAEFKDIEGIVDVNIRTWRTAYEGIIDEEFLKMREIKKTENISRMQKNFSDEIINGERKYQIVAELNNEIIGFVSYGSVRKSESLNLENIGEIYAIYVLKEHQGKNIGKKLLENAFSDLIHIENYEKALVWTLTENSSTEFYKRMGGKPSFNREIIIGKQSLNETGFIYGLRGGV